MSEIHEKNAPVPTTNEFGDVLFSWSLMICVS